MMNSAVPKLQALLRSSGLKKPTAKLYSNVTGRDLTEGMTGDPGQWIADLMARQTGSPVYWQETMENMAADGIKTFVEIGPGSTLSGLAKKIDHELVTMRVEDYDTLMETMNAIKGLISGEGTAAEK